MESGWLLELLYVRVHRQEAWTSRRYLFDFIILLVQALFQPLEKVFYGIVLVIIYTVTLDKMLLMGTTKTEVRVVSDYAAEICDAILKRMDRGVTLLSAKG